MWDVLVKGLPEEFLIQRVGGALPEGSEGTAPRACAVRQQDVGAGRERGQPQPSHRPPAPLQRPHSQPCQSPSEARGIEIRTLRQASRGARDLEYNPSPNLGLEHLLLHEGP